MRLNMMKDEIKWNGMRLDRMRQDGPLIAHSPHQLFIVQ